MTAEVTVASRSEAVAFTPSLRAALRAQLPGDARELLCFAGHDAGILAERIPAGMVFVRNATGVSHAPAEHVELADAAAAAGVMLGGLRRLSGG